MSRILIAGLIGMAVASPASAERVFGLTADNRIVTFDSSTPGTITSSGAISGVAQGDTLTGLDLRATNRTLYSIGTSGNLYSITGNSNGYTANVVGTIAPAPTGGNYGIDFNPTVDRLRYVSSTGQNLRINPANAATTTDGSLTLNGNPFGLTGVAYTNNRPGVTTTALYGLDAATDSLVRSTNANAGTYVNTNIAGATFGPLGVSFGAGDAVGFDISGASGAAFFSLADNFYTVSTSTGSASLVGGLGTSGVTGLAAGAVPEPASWAMLITGFGLIGTTMRRRTARLALAR